MNTCLWSKSDRVRICLGCASQIQVASLNPWAREAMSVSVYWFFLLVLFPLALNQILIDWAGQRPIPVPRDEIICLRMGGTKVKSLLESEDLSCARLRPSNLRTDNNLVLMGLAPGFPALHVCAI